MCNKLFSHTIICKINKSAKQWPLITRLDNRCELIPFMTFYICNTKVRIFAITLVLIAASEWTAAFQAFGQGLGSCKSSKVSCVMCRHACWMWRDSTVRAQTAKRRTKRSESWQGTRWISRLSLILFSKFLFNSLEPWEEVTRKKYSSSCLESQQPGFLSCLLDTWVTH